jgi:hypothetical protein
MFVRVTLATRFTAWKSAAAKEVQGMGAVKSDIGRYAIIPEWLLVSGASPRAIQLFAILACRYADREGVAWPSRKRLAEDMRASVDTVDRAIDELIELGALSINLRMREDRGQASNLYTLHLIKGGWARMPMGVGMDAQGGMGMDAQGGMGMDAALTIPIMNQSLFVEDKGVVTSNGVEDSNIRADAKNCAARGDDSAPAPSEQTRSPGLPKQPKQRSTTHSVTLAEMIAEGIAREDAEDWLLVRKQHRAPLTRAAWAQLKCEASKAGLSLAEVVRMCAANGWRGFRASWLAERARVEKRSSRPALSGFAQKNYGETGPL